MQETTFDIAADVLAAYDPEQAVDLMQRAKRARDGASLGLVTEELADALFVAGEDPLAEEVLREADIIKGMDELDFGHWKTSGLSPQAWADELTARAEAATTRPRDARLLVNCLAYSVDAESKLPEDVITTAKTRAAQTGQRINVVRDANGVYGFFSDRYVTERGIAWESVLATAEPFNCTR